MAAQQRFPLCKITDKVQTLKNEQELSKSYVLLRLNMILELREEDEHKRKYLKFPN